MKVHLLTISGEKGKEISLPKVFSSKIRSDLIQKINETKKMKQPYGPSPVAGNQASASGKLKHHRHVWKSQYGHGWSRVPRKVQTRRGSQFNFVGATVPNTRGGRRAHPPKVISFIGRSKVNKKELKLAISAAISATASKEIVSKKYSSLEKKDIKDLPLVIEEKFSTLKSKEAIKSLKKILGEKLFSVAVKKKSVRSGRGKLRGRKHKSNLGALIVTGNDEKLKTKAFDIVKTKNLSLESLSKGNPGRLTIYTEGAIKEMGEKFK